MDNDTRQVMVAMSAMLAQFADLWNSIDYFWQEKYNTEIGDILNETKGYPFEKGFEDYKWDVVDWVENVRTEFDKALREEED